MARQKLILVSMDALVFEDLAYLSRQPSFGRILRQGSLVERVRSIYPTLTYPCHATMATGRRVCGHGITNNTHMVPGEENPPWLWYHDAYRAEDLLDAAKKKGLTTAAIGWPTMGLHPHADYLVGEIAATKAKTEEAFRRDYQRTGTTDALWEAVGAPNIHFRTEQANVTRFNAAVCCDIFRKYRPDLTLLHIGQPDSFRHKNGVFPETINSILDECEKMLTWILQAIEDSGVHDDTNLVITADHGQMESLKDGHTKYIPPDVYRTTKPFVRPDDPSFTIDEGVLTIKLNEFMRNHAPYVRELLETIPNISLVRLDIRNNIGGNTYHAAKVAELFFSGTFQSCHKWTQVRNAIDTAGASQLVRYSEERIQQYIRDGMFTEEAVADAKSVMNRTKYETYTSSHGVENQCAIYEGPLQILISRNTMSAAEDFTAMFKGNKRGTLIGEPTYGSTGTPCMIPLRCGGRAQVVSVGYRLLDGTEFIGKGIMPDVEMDAASI